MKIEISNRGPGDVLRLVLEPVSSIPGCINVASFTLDYPGDGGDAKKRLVGEAIVSVDDLKAAVDSLSKVCKAKKTQ